MYESDAALAQYLWLHYGDAQARVPAPFRAALGFPARCARLASRSGADGAAPSSRAKTGMEGGTPLPPLRALDIGCAVGRSTFELARDCAEVIGIDFSARFIAAAQTLQRGESIPYAIPDQGDLTHALVARAPADVDRARVRFEVGDAMDLRADLGLFDVVLAANLICRLTEPRRFLDLLPALVKTGGTLLLTTPSTWKQIYTPRENWIGGYAGANGPVHTLDGLKESLSPHFTLESRTDEPLLIPEHARKFEFILAEATRWRRRGSKQGAGRE
ncbi:MAG TPA: putative 4-mercaptohistidine N1-methyltransferase [Kiritimatiellia bacterium]|nr:putative 4-mercaptohistidine N1-methyltransferase [Kiritimatiellia bacterium]